MPQLIDIPGVGTVQYPDDAPDSAIAADAQKLYADHVARGRSALSFFQETHPEPVQGPNVEHADSLAPATTTIQTGSSSTPPPELREQVTPPRNLETLLRGTGEPLPVPPGIVPRMQRPENLSPLEALTAPTQMPAPRVTKEQVASALDKTADVLRGGRPSGAKTPGLMAGAIAGGENAVADVVDFMTSPGGIATVLTGGVAGAPGAAEHVVASQIPKATAYLFAEQMAQSLPDQFEQVYGALKRGDSAEATRGLLNGALSLGVIGHAARVAVTPKALPGPGPVGNGPTEPTPTPAAAEPVQPQPLEKPNIPIGQDLVDEINASLLKNQVAAKPEQRPAEAAETPKNRVQQELERMREEAKRSAEAQAAAPAEPSAEVGNVPTEPRTATAAEKEEAAQRIAYTLATTDDAAGEVGLTIDHYVENGTLTPEEATEIERRIRTGEVRSELSPEETRYHLQERFAGREGLGGEEKTGLEGKPNPQQAGLEPNQPLQAGSPESDATREQQSVQTGPAKPEETLPAAAEEVKPVEAQPKRGVGLRARKIFDNETELTGPDILDWIKDNSPLLSKSAAKRNWSAEKFRRNQSLWDDAPKLQRPHHNVIYGENGSTPDVVAQAAFDAGQISEPSVNVLWDDIDRASKARSHAYEQQRHEQKILQQEIEQHEDWVKAKEKGNLQVSTDELQPGDTLHVAGEEMKVTHRDEATGDITVEDGSKFGRQTVASGQSIYVEKLEHAAEEKPTPAPAVEGSGDKILDTLNKLVDATRPEDWRKETNLGPLKLPAWATQQLLHDVLRVIRASYQAGKKLAEAIEAGVQWIKGRNLQGFNEDEARAWLTHEAQNANPVIERVPTFGSLTFDDIKREVDKGQPVNLRRQEAIAAARKEPRFVLQDEPDGTVTVTGTKGLRLAGTGTQGAPTPAGPASAAPASGPKSYEAKVQRRDEILQRLNEIKAQERGPTRDLPPELRSERFKLARESLEIQRELSKNRDYVADLLRDLDRVSNELVTARQAGNGAHARELADQFQAIAEGSLKMVPEKLFQEVYRDLVQRGEIMGSQAPELPHGRTIGELINWLQQNRIDSPRLGLRERFSLAERLARLWDKSKSAAARAGHQVAAAWEAFKEQYKHPPVDDDLRSLTKDWLFQKQWTGIETHRWVQEIRRAVPQPLRRWAMSVYLEASGDLNTLRAQADVVPGRYKKIWETAMNLTADEKRLADQVRRDFEAKLEDGLNLGLLEKGRENYGVPQIWDKAPNWEGEYDPTGQRSTARNPKAQLDPRNPFFALERTVPTYFDGIMAEGIPKSLDIADLVGIYNAEFHNSLADRSMIGALRNAKAPDGLPGVLISGSAKVEPREGGGRVYFIDSNWRPKEAVTADGRPYRTIDHWALRNWKFASQTETGNPVIVHGDFLVHPDYYKFLKNELSRSFARDPEGAGRYLNPILKSAAFLKASKFASATFHMATIAEHALFHGILPITKGIELDPARNPKLFQLIRNGMDLGFSGQQELFEEGLTSHGGIWGQVPYLGDAMRITSDFLFKDYIPKIKAKTGLAILDRNERRYSKELSPEQIYELTGRQVNAAFGIQNWRLMGTNKFWLDVNRLLLTAPDFLLSRSKVVAQALKPYNREQRYFLAVQAIGVYAACRALNYVLDDDPHFEPENALSVVYRGRAYSGRFIVNDIWHLMQDPVSFAAGRLGPLSRAMIEAFTQRDMRTGTRIPVPFETESKSLRAVQVLIKDLAEWLIPAGAEGLMPGAKGRGDTSIGQVALATLGVGSRKYTAQTQTYELARDFNHSSNDPGVQLAQKRRDAEAHAASAYSRLDNLLDAGDTRAARGEYEALLAEGYKDDSIERHYQATERPFTSSNSEQEAAFREWMDKHHPKLYDKAIAEREKLEDAFYQMLKEPAPK